MSDAYLDLHNLETSITEFAVSRIIDDDLQASPECQLPEDLEVTLNLPSLVVTLPELECNYDIDLPLVPLPHFCTPTLDSSVEFTGCARTDVTGVLGFSTDGACGYTLGGSINICTDLPCPDGFTAGGELTITTTGDARYVQLYGSATLDMSGECGFLLSGDLTLQDMVPNLDYICDTANFRVELETEEIPFLINIIEDFNITIYPKLVFEQISSGACTQIYKITIDQVTAAVIENLEVQEITFCNTLGEETTRKFLCLTPAVP